MISRVGRKGCVGLLAAICWVGFARADDTESSLDLKLYGNVDFGVSSGQMAHPQFANETVHNSFGAASLDLFPTFSRDRLSFLAEIMIEGGEGNDIALDLERVQIAYLFAEWLRVRVGRAHTAFGYYGDTYHHGKLFDLTTSRPYFIQFEDAGGFLLAHTVGIGLEGTFKSNVMDLRYDFDVGNGRPSDPTSVPVLYATQNEKQLNLRLRLMPKFLDGLMVGGNVQYVPIGASPPPVGAAAPAVTLTNSLNEYDVGAHIAYMEQHFHLVLEGAIMIRRDTVTGDTYRHHLGFFEGGYTVGAFTPYARIEGAKFDPKNDPYMANQNLTSNMATGSWAQTGHFSDLRVGLRWDALEYLALKLEYRHFETDSASLFSSFDGGVAQAAFGF